MLSVIIPIAIVCFVTAAIYGCNILTKNNPKLIRGFKWGNTPEEREEDELWLKRYRRNMTIAAVVIFFGGITSALFKNTIALLIFLILPSTVAILYSTFTQPRQSKLNKASAIIISFAVVIACILVPVYFTKATDLETTMYKDHIEIGGIYGTTIYYDDITEIKTCDRLPEISLRTNGLSLNDVKLGYFKTADNEKIIIFAHSDSKFIQITDKKQGKIYLNSKHPEKTEEILRQIQHSMKGQE